MYVYTPVAEVIAEFQQANRRILWLIFKASC